MYRVEINFLNSDADFVCNQCFVELTDSGYCYVILPQKYKADNVWRFAMKDIAWIHICDYEEYCNNLDE